jgi:hypothetical protein
MSGDIPRRLPAGFEELECFVDHWGGHTTQERMSARCSVEMPEIRQFYDAMTERAEDALVHLEQFPMDAMPPDALQLLALVLALAQAHIAVEVHGAARAPNTPWPNSIRLTSGLPLLG